MGRPDSIEAAVKGFYEKGGKADEVSGDKEDLESPYSKKMGPIREKWIQKNNEKDLFEKLFNKFGSSMIHTKTRPAFKLGQIPGVKELFSHPYVKMGLSIMQLDVKDFKEFGLDLDEDDEAGDSPSPAAETEEVFDDADEEIEVKEK